jgi:hypothetical protein
MRMNTRVRARARTATDGDDGPQREVTTGQEGGSADPRLEVDDYPFATILRLPSWMILDLDFALQQEDLVS